jgi:hypothetical protein
MSKCCSHRHLHFGEGGFYVTCYECYDKWMAVDSNGQPDRNRSTGTWGLRGVPEYYAELPLWKRVWWSLWMKPGQYNARLHSRLLNAKK